jgi:hypothetical protein
MSLTRYLPVPRDDNGATLLDRGTALSFTTLTLTTDHKDLLFPTDCKEFAILVNSGTLYFRGTEYGTRVYLDASAVVDSGGGTVTITTGEDHGYTVGDPCTIAGTTNYNGTLEAGSATDQLIITATYVAETPAVTAYVDGYRDGSTTIGTGPIPIVAEAAQKVMELWSDAGGATVTIYKWR